MVRRLSPNSRKVEVGNAGKLLSSSDMLRQMGREIACCHAADAARLGAVRSDAAGRKSGWLVDHARAAADVVRRAFAAFA